MARSVGAPIAFLPNPALTVPNPLRRDPDVTGVCGGHPPWPVHPHPCARAPRPETAAPVRRSPYPPRPDVCVREYATGKRPHPDADPDVGMRIRPHEPRRVH